MNDLRDEFGFAPDDVLKVHAHVPRQHFDVCDIRQPRTGLEMKFPIRQVIAMALAGLDTGDTELYNPETAMQEDLVRLRQKVELHPEDYDDRHVSEMVVELHNGRVFKKWMDVGTAAEDTDTQWVRLTDKFLRPGRAGGGYHPRPAGDCAGRQSRSGGESPSAARAAVSI